ncbi:MAG: pantetheine-phosphate adenylyltransferase [Clostridiales bacterium]|nr:pantetheine-phosphate adenylyltransferase [Clostridiales bacterium]
MKVCVFAGTFDPITIGHTFVIEKCLEMFDKVVVALGVNQDKTPMFDLESRKKMIELAVGGNKKVEIASFDGMLVDFMKKNGIKVNVRGIRDIDDYKYETTMERFNRDMYGDMTTIYIPTPKELVHISSSAIRTILSMGTDASEYLPKVVCEFISAEKLGK